jgi:hypothetical protein
MWAGWSDNTSLLRVAPVVIEAVGEGYGGPIRWLDGAESPSKPKVSLRGVRTPCMHETEEP